MPSNSLSVSHSFQLSALLFRFPACLPGPKFAVCFHQSFCSIVSLRSLFYIGLNFADPLSASDKWQRCGRCPSVATLSVISAFCDDMLTRIFASLPVYLLIRPSVRPSVKHAGPSVSLSADLRLCDVPQIPVSVTADGSEKRVRLQNERRRRRRRQRRQWQRLQIKP